MRRAHLVFGLVLFVVFAITGQYMRADFPNKDSMDQYLRVLMRSRHIYILFSALIHLGLGVYLLPRNDLWRRAIQYVGSVVLILSSALLIAAFVHETYTVGAFSQFSRFGIYTSLAGVSLHMIAAIADRGHEKV